MRKLLAISAALVAGSLLSSPARAETCSVGSGCSITCDNGCAAVLVDGKCSTACADADGNLPGNFVENTKVLIDRLTLKGGQPPMRLICFKGVPGGQTRGLSGQPSCQ